MNTFTVFCGDNINAGGTTWISAVQAETVDQACDKAKTKCAADWGCDSPDDVRIVGVIEGDVRVLHWED
jgi:hypothetical protein